ncbi:MAG: protein kinase [Methylacidiphilales bacterium]|nr:protein kinase [Candidatus Methylacidiphilales bacterium]
MTCAKCRNPIDITGLDPGDGITCPYCGHEFTITRQFGNFLLERQIGAGGMGTVYQGRDVTLNRVVAVKVLRPELVSDHKFLATFLREAEITASLNHPNIMQVYAFGQHEGVYYMVVELISGGSLDDKINNLGRITELEGIEIGIAVARGLECALQRGGLIHRDIKPGNILFNSNNTPKVVDFGLSLTYDTMDHFDGEIWGTPYYVAPEKLEREKEDFRSDLYSLGATLFHAISGRPPYEGEDPNEVAMKHLSGKVISLKAFVPNISDQTAYAVSKAMARYPEDRYESYADFIEQLEDAKRRITDPTYREKQEEDVEIIETESSAKYNLLMIIGLVVIVLVVLGLLAWKIPSLLKPTQAPPPPADLNDYAPKTSDGSSSSAVPAGEAPATAPAPVVAPTAAPTPIPQPSPTIAPTAPSPTPVAAVYHGPLVVSVQFPQFSQGKMTSPLNKMNYQAGVVPVQNWNVVNTDTGTSPSSNTKLIDADGNSLGSSVLIDTSGAKTPIGFTFSGYTKSDATNNKSFPDPVWYQDNGLTDSFLEGGVIFNETGTPLTLTLTGLDPKHTYTLIVYVSSVWNAPGNSAKATIALGGTTYYVKTSNALGNWTQVTSTSADSPSVGNYVKFTGLTGSATQTLTITGAFVGLAGFQLIQ